MSRRHHPFESVFSGHLAAARRRLDCVEASIEHLVAPNAIEGLLSGLLSDLSYACAPVLLDRFRSFPGRRWLQRGADGAHTAYVARMVDGGLDQLFVELPELARVVDRLIADWHHRARSLLERIAADRDVLAMAGVGLPVQSCVPITDGVIRVGGGHGQAITYKDRPTAMDVGWAELLKSIDYPAHRLFVPGVVDRGDYGWMEWLPHSPPSGSARRRYWYRAGMLMSLMSALGGGDLHAGNVRMVGEHPVVVDAEVMLRPRRTRTEDLAASVIATGWLPTATEAERCGLAAEVFEQRPARWLDVNTDSVRRRPLRSPLIGIPESVAAYFAVWGEDMTAFVTQGFRSMYRRILSDGLPLESLSEAAPRVLLRTSYHYQDAIEASLEPTALMSSDARSRPLRRLAASTPSIVTDHAEAAERVRSAEMASMWRLQVPRFAVDASGRGLRYEGRSLGEIFEETPLHRAKRLMGQMRPLALESECEVITESIERAARNDFGVSWHLQLQAPAVPP